MNRGGFVWRRLSPAVAALVLLLGACGNDDPAGPAAGAVPDFQLVDVNPASPSYAESVSPRDHLQKVSAWYFGHAT